MKNILSLEETAKIDRWCKEFKIKKYTINNDGSIDVDGHVSITEKFMSKLPLKFNFVDGSFNCSNNNLTTLEGCPVRVNGGFYCMENKGLTSLKYAPEEINGHFDCSNCSLTSLEYSPIKINGYYVCSYNKLTDLRGCTNIIPADFYCNSNPITSLNGCPEVIGGDFYCRFTELSSLESLSSRVKIMGKVNLFDNSLPGEVYNKLLIGSNDHLKTFLKYQNDFDVWDNGFNEDNFNELMAEIKDGLE